MGKFTKPAHRKMDVLIVGNTDKEVHQRFFNFRILKVGDNYYMFNNVGYVFSAAAPTPDTYQWFKGLGKRSQDKKIHWIL